MPSLMDDFLSRMGQVQQGMSQFATGMEGARKNTAAGLLRNEMDGLLTSQDPASLSRMAELGNASGDNTMMETLYKSKLAQLSPKNKPLDEEALKAAGYSAGIVKTALGMKPDEQKEFLNRVKERQSLQEKQYEFSTSEGRRSTQAILGEYERNFGKLETKLADDRNMINSMKDAISKGKMPTDNMVQNFAQRYLGGDKGPLSDQDVARVLPRTFAGDSAAFFNYISGNPQSKWTPEVKEAFQAIISTADSKFNDYVDLSLGQELARNVENPLLMEGGKPHGKVSAFAKQYGYKYDAEKRSWSKESGTGSYDLSTLSDENKALFEMAQKKGNKAAMDKLHSLGTKKLTPEQIALVKQKLQ